MVNDDDIVDIVLSESNEQDVKWQQSCETQKKISFDRS